jgi:predicted phage terminase large subunit-like protein
MAKTKIKWHPFIPHKPTQRQLAALKAAETTKEVFFGGALGGGKSDLLLMAGLQYMDVPGYASIIFRRQLSDLKQPGALLDRARAWLRKYTVRGGPVRYVPSEHAYHFKTFNPDGSRGNDAKLCFGYSGDANASDRYQSAEYQTVCFDELSHWERSNDYEWLLTRLRKTVCSTHGKDKQGNAIYLDDCQECQLKKRTPVRMLAASNPGGQGGSWIKKYFSIVPDPKLYPDKRDAIDAIMKGIKVPFVSTHPTREFIPSFLEDNPYLDQKDYDQLLTNLAPEMKSALRDGNWEARIDTRFKRQNVRYYDLFPTSYKLGPVVYPLSNFKKVFATVDPAGTTKKGIIDQKVANRSPSYTVISIWGVTENKDLFWLDMKRFREEIPKVVTEVVAMYTKWVEPFPSIYFKMETNGVGLGPSQYVRDLGVPVKANKKGTDKLENSIAAQLLMDAGKVYFPHNAPWINEAEDEVFGWTGMPNETDDIIDTLSDAATEIGPLDEVLGENAMEHREKTLTVMSVPSPILPYQSIRHSPLYSPLSGYRGYA